MTYVKADLDESRQMTENFRSWIVCAACLLINGLMFGQGRLSGMFLVASVRKFNVSRQEAAFAYTQSLAIRHLVGPIAGFLGQKYGVRVVTSLGAIFSAIGIGFCFLADRMIEVSLLYGLVFGVGFGLGNILLPVAINQNFDKHRATANGISFAGASLGSFLLPPLCDALMAEYDLNGTFLILSGIILNCLPLSMLLKNPDLCSTEQNAKHVHSKAEDAETHEHSASKRSNSLPLLEKRERQEFNGHSAQNQNNSQGEINTSCPANDHKTCYANPGFESYSEKSEELRIVNATNLMSTEKCREFVLEEFHIHLRASEETSKEVTGNKHGTLMKTLSLFINPVFIIVAMLYAVFGICILGIVAIIVDYSKDLGLNESHAKYILMAFSVGDFVGRLGLGVIPDRGWMSKLNFGATCMLLQGLTLCSISWVSSFEALATVMFLYGLCESGYITINPLLVSEFVGEDLQTIAIPSANLITGVLYAAMPVLIGYFREELGSYTGLLYTFGGLCLASFLAIFSLPYLRKRQLHNRKLLK